MEGQEQIVHSLVGKVLRIILHISLRGLKVISLVTKTIKLPPTSLQSPPYEFYKMQPTEEA